MYFCIMSSLDDISKMLQIESEKLDELTRSAISQELSAHEIVETYYQVINVSSIITIFKQQSTLGDVNSLMDKISKAEKMISKFNAEAHPKILAGLTAAIAENTRNLQARSPQRQSQKEAEGCAAAYEELRQKMSTWEFVEQYGKELSNDS